LNQLTSLSLFQMEPNSHKGQQTQSYVPTIQDFAIKPKSQIQTHTYPTHPEIKIQNQYESFTEFPPLTYGQAVKSTPQISQKPQTSQLQILSKP